MLICASRFQPQAAIEDVDTMKELGESDNEHDVNNADENEAEENENEDSSVENEAEAEAKENENEDRSVENEDEAEAFVKDVVSTRRTVHLLPKRQFGTEVQNLPTAPHTPAAHSKQSENLQHTRESGHAFVHLLTSQAFQIQNLLIISIFQYSYPI